MVPEEGVEPTHPFGYGILSPARLPVPPLRPELLRISEPADPQVTYRLVPFQLPEQLPPEKVPVIVRRSDDSVALNV